MWLKGGQLRLAETLPQKSAWGPKRLSRLLAPGGSWWRVGLARLQELRPQASLGPQGWGAGRWQTGQALSAALPRVRTAAELRRARRCLSENLSVGVMTRGRAA